MVMRELQEESQSSKAQAKHRLSNACKEARMKSGLTQKALAEMVSIRPAYLSQIETGHRSPSFGLLNKLASALGTQASQLMLEAELPKEGDKGSLLYLLTKVVEQAPDVGKLLGSLGALAAVEASQSLARARAAVIEAEQAATAAAVAKVKSGEIKHIDAKIMKQIIREAFAAAEAAAEPNVKTT